MRYKHRGHMHIPTTGAALRPEKLETLLYGEPVSVTIMKAQHAEQEAVRQEARQRIAQSQAALKAQQKEEEAMSSLRESLEKALAEKEARAAKLQSTLDDWGDDEPINVKIDTATATNKEPIVTTEPINISVSQQTFEFIKANSGISVKKAISALVARGLNESSVTSLISQMTRKGMFNRVDGYLTAQVKYYRPVGLKKAKPKVASNVPSSEFVSFQQAPAETPTGGIAALASRPDVAHNITALLDNISVNEARALYVELKKLFGGN